MYFKLATGNIKKSYKDYTIYFLTLILGVCIFYSFNAIDSQKVVIDVKSSTADYISDLTESMYGVSVLVSIILGCLMLYANNFLIKKRKKELGIYMTLGMGKRKISRILVTETSLVGIISLIVGLILGMGVSQFVSAFAFNLFDVGMEDYRFSISVNAIGKSILYFGIMFLLVMIFNVFFISKYKIIDLLTAGKKSENIKFKKSFIYLLSFILCLVSLGFSYKSLLRMGLDTRNSMFIPSIIIGVLGTVLFFFSLAGVVLYIANKNGKIYFKELNIFLVKQISSKINTNFISMSIICIMLFITILVLSISVSVKMNNEAKLAKNTPFDASISIYNQEEDNIEDVLHKINFKLSENERCSIHREYLMDMNVGDLLLIEDEKVKGFRGVFIKKSEYNKMREIKGEKEISLSKDEVLLMSNYNQLVKPFNEKLKTNKKVNIKGKEYTVKNEKMIEDNLQTYIVSDNTLTIVINDEFLQDYSKVYKSVLNVMYSDDNREENNKKYNEIQEKYSRGKHEELNISHIESYAKDTIYHNDKMDTIGILFVAIYLGIVFLITSMAVLALQQLSEASDSIDRYKALMRIGANKKLIDKTIFIQILIHFSLPVVLAIIHSIIGVIVINGEISKFNEMDIRFSALITAIIFIVIYTGYFYITYTGYKNIVKNNI